MARLSHQDVLGLEVSVDDALRMEILDATHELSGIESVGKVSKGI